MNSTVDGHQLLAEILNTQPADPLGATDAHRPEQRFTVARFILTLLLERAITVVPTRDPMPVLKNVQIEATTNRLRLVATDTELSIIATTEIVEVASPGVSVFPARKLLDILREARDSDVEIQVVGQAAAVTIGPTTWNLSLNSGEDYPPMPVIAEAVYTSVNRAGYLAALNAVRYAASRDPNRANLRQIDVRAATMTASDGARFAQAPTTPAGTYQIPLSAVDGLVKLLKASELDTIQVGQAAHHLIYRLGADTFLATKMVVPFPDLEAALLRPALTNNQDLGVDRAELLAAIKRVRINADQTTSAIALTLTPGRVTVAARDKFRNAATESVPADWHGPERTLVVNHSFLTDLIAHHDGPSLVIKLGADTKTKRTPLMVREDNSGTVGVVQQMHLDWVTG